MLLNAAVVTILTALLYTYITQLYLHYAAVTSAMLLNAAAATIRTYSITYTYITQLYLHYAAVTSAMLLNAAAAATILTALLILTLRSYTYTTQQ